MNTISYRFGVRLAITFTILLANATLPVPTNATGIKTSAAKTDLSILPLTVGSQWAFRDTTGKTVIRVAARERFAGIECYRLDWTGVARFQSEFWQVREDGIYVVGRRILDHVTRFTTPYLFVRNRLMPGDSWESSVSTEDSEQILRYLVGEEEEVSTPAGRFRAIPVSERGKGMEYRRWYANGVGMVKETTSLPDGFLLDEKLLLSD